MQFMELELQGFQSLAPGAQAEVLVSKGQVIEQGGALAPALRLVCVYTLLGE